MWSDGGYLCAVTSVTVLHLWVLVSILGYLDDKHG